MADYVLKMTSEHCKVVQDALDMYSRVLMGQWEIVSEKLAGSISIEERLRFRDIIDAAKREILNMGLGASHGIHNQKDVSDNARVAYDLTQVLRHEVWSRQPATDRQNYGVDAYPPNRSSENVPLAEILKNP